MITNKAQWITLHPHSGSPTRILVPDRRGFGIENARQLIHQAIRDHVGQVSLDSYPYGGDEAFFVGDLGAILRTHERWQRQLPQVKPFYCMYKSCCVARTHG